MNVKSSTVYAWLTAMLFGVATLGIADIFMDLHAHMSILHVVVELGIVVFSLVPAFYMLRRWRIATMKAHHAQQHLQEYLYGLGKSIEQSFNQWRLTEAEKKTALYILKGLSHREIAQMCHRSEGTVRQHAVSVYRKAGITSRAEFSAHFLQKLLPPQPAPDSQDDAVREAEFTADFAQESGPYKVATD
ncbi:MAG: helix-turn-helix transcriptional regulator [Pseudomonadota bacterium]